MYHVKDVVAISTNDQQLANMIDGDFATCALIAPNSDGVAWVGLDLPEKVSNITHIRVVTSGTSALDVYNNNLPFLGSTLMVDAGVFNNTNHYISEVDSSVEHRKAYILIEKLNRNETFSICEVEVFGFRKYMYFLSSL